MTCGLSSGQRFGRHYAIIVAETRKKTEEVRLRQELYGALRDNVARVIYKDAFIYTNKDYSNILRQMGPLLRSWYAYLESKVDVEWAIEKRKMH